MLVPCAPDGLALLESQTDSTEAGVGKILHQRHRAERGDEKPPVMHSQFREWPKEELHHHNREERGASHHRGIESDDQRRFTDPQTREETFGRRQEDACETSIKKHYEE